MDPLEPHRQVLGHAEQRGPAARRPRGPAGRSTCAERRRRQDRAAAPTGAGRRRARRGASRSTSGRRRNQRSSRAAAASSPTQQARAPTRASRLRRSFVEHPLLLGQAQEPPGPDPARPTTEAMPTTTIAWPDGVCVRRPAGADATCPTSAMPERHEQHEAAGEPHAGLLGAGVLAALGVDAPGPRSAPRAAGRGRCRPTSWATSSVSQAASAVGIGEPALSTAHACARSRSTAATRAGPPRTPAAARRAPAGPTSNSAWGTDRPERRREDADLLDDPGPRLLRRGAPLRAGAPGTTPAASAARHSAERPAPAAARRTPRRPTTAPDQRQRRADHGGELADAARRPARPAPASRPARRPAPHRRPEPARAPRPSPPEHDRGVEVGTRPPAAQRRASSEPGHRYDRPGVARAGGGRRSPRRPARRTARDREVARPGQRPVGPRPPEHLGDRELGGVGAAGQVLDRDDLGDPRTRRPCGRSARRRRCSRSPAC